MKHVPFLTGCMLCCSTILSAQSSPKLIVDTNRQVSEVSPTLYGLMTEEINYSYDGGLYGEMVRNRTFRGSWQGHEFWTVVMHGNSKAETGAGDDGPSTALPKSMKLIISR